MSDKTFSIILQANYPGFLRGDELTCISIEKPMPGSTVIIERPDCGQWPILFDEAGPEIDNGAKVVGQIISLHRNLLMEARQI